MVLSKGHMVVRPGYSRLSGDVARVADRGGESGKPNQVDWVCREYDMDRQTDRVTWDSRDNRDGYLSWWIDWATRDNQGNRDGGSGQQANQVTRVSQGNRDGNPKSGNYSWVTENLVLQKARVQRSRLTRKTWLRRTRLTQKEGLWEIQLTRKTELCMTQEAGNRKKERVLLQAKGQLHSGAQGVLPRHKNADCKRCVKESWLRKKKKKSRTIGLTVYGP
jgi:hypothetical protein